MKRVPVVLLMLLLVAACGFAAWFALQDTAVDPGGGAQTPVAETPDQQPAPIEAAETDEPARRRVDEGGRAARARVDSVRGRILHGATGIAGATIEVFAAPPGEHNEKLDMAREIFGDAFSDEELKAMDDRFSSMSGGGGADPEAMQEAMSTGMEMVGKIMSDPSFLDRAMELQRMDAAGFESDAKWPRVGAATSDADGAFAIEKLPEGRVELRVRAPGFRRVRRTVDVGSSDVTVALHPGAVLAGVVVSEGQPVAGATVRTKTTTLTTDGSGGFRLDGAVAPQESVLVSARGFVSAGRSVPLTAGAEGDPITIELRPAATVRGIVLSRAGAPIEGASIRTHKGGGFNPMQFMQLAQQGNDVAAPPPSTVTDANGRFELDGLPAASTMLRAELKGYLPATTEALALTAGQALEDVEFVLVAEAVVAGRVTAPDGAAVVGATVKVELPAPTGLGAMMAGMFGGSWATATTAEDGSYRVGSLHAGERRVRVESAQYLHAEATLTLTEEGRVTHDVRLGPGFELSGTVVGPTGSPVADAAVSVSWPAEGGAQNPMAAMLGMGGGADATTTTDAEGRFSFTGLQGGPYEVTASSSAFLDGSVADVNPGSGDVLLQLRGAASISGVVVTTDGKPLGGVWVHRKGGRRRGGGNPMMAMFQQDPKELTDAQGRFTHGGLEPGEYTLFGRRKGWADSEKTKVTVGEGEAVEGFEVVIRDGVALAGRVITKGSGEPVAGAVVYVPEGSGPLAGFNPMEAIDGPPTAPSGATETKTDANGDFVLEGLTPGRVTVEVRAEDRAPASLARVEVPGSDVVVEMGVGGAVEGLVIDDAGNAVVGVQVILSGGAMGFGRNRVAQTDATGFYRMERIVPGTYQLMKMDSSSAFGVGGMNAVTIKEGETLRKDFKPDTTGGRISGVVMRDGAPLLGAIVMLTGGNTGMKFSTSGDDGSFSFEALDPGDYTVSVQAEMMGGGSSSQAVKVDRPGARVTGIRIDMSSQKITGRVVDADSGKGVPMAQVVLSDPSAGAATSLQGVLANQRGQAFTDDQGRFTLSGVEAGPFTMRIAAAGYAEATREGIAAGADVQVKLSQGAEFEVTVLGPDGAPVAGATVISRDSSGRETIAFSMSMQGVTDSRGVATLRLGPGRYVLLAESNDLPSAEVEADASAGAATVRLPAGGALEIVITRAGEPVVGVRAALVDAEGNPIQKRISMSNLLGSGGVSDADGRIVREGLPIGAVTVVVTPPEGAPVQRSATVTPGAPTRVEIELP